MSRGVRFLASLAVAGLVLSSARTQNLRGAGSRALTVCEVLAAPLKYNGQVITIRGRVSGTDEGTWLVGDRCAGVFAAGDYVWPSVIYLAMPTIAAPLRVHQAKFKFDWESQRKTDAKYEELRKVARAECLEFTYSGMFDTREEWSKAKLTYPNGTWKYAGFGHLGEAPGQLLLRSEDDVAVDPDCRTAKGSVKK